MTFQKVFLVKKFNENKQVNSKIKFKNELSRLSKTSKLKKKLEYRCQPNQGLGGRQKKEKLRESKKGQESENWSNIDWKWSMKVAQIKMNPSQVQSILALVDLNLEYILFSSLVWIAPKK